MFIPIRNDSPLRRSPYMNWALIAANVVMFIIQASSADQLHGLALSPRNPELYQFFTYQFLHGGITHLLGNMVFLYVFGNNVNDKMGHLGYLAFYLAGGVSAGLAYVMWQAGGTSMVGASGSISAVTGAYLILFPRANVTVLYFFFMIGTFEIASLWLILGFFAYDLFLMPQDTGVAHLAHIGGTIFGCAVCFAMLWGHLLPRDQFDVVALVRQWNRRRQYRDAVSGGWNPYLSPAPPGAAAPVPGGPAWSPGGPSPFATGGRAAGPPPDPRMGRIMDVRAAIADALNAHDLPRAADLYIELKTLDPQQVLARQAQLDVANQLAGQQKYPQAAEAYESFLRHYPKFEQIEQVELMLGLIYARYLAQYRRAKECLLRALAKLHGDREVTMARAELERIEPLLHVKAPPPLA
jgi:membrane associated rhomboid family serine protease